MKIIRNTPDQLIIENNPVWLAVFVTVFALIFFAVGLFSVTEEPLMGILFMVGGLGIGFGFNMALIRRTQLILDAPANLVTLKRRSWFGLKQWSWDLQYLERAIKETSNSGDTKTHRAALVMNGGMDAGTHPITIVYSSGRGAETAVYAVNGWLDSQPPKD